MRQPPDKTIEAQVLLLLEAGRILFGETFDWLPKFTCHNEIDLATADADRDQLLTHAATPETTERKWWMNGCKAWHASGATLHRWEVVRTLADALNDVRSRFSRCRSLSRQ